METGRPLSGRPIRLTDERWRHIMEEHPEISEMKHEVLSTIDSPEKVLEGPGGSLLAVRGIRIGKHLVVVYREEETDGFIITAFVNLESNG